MNEKGNIAFLQRLDTSVCI